MSLPEHSGLGAVTNCEIVDHIDSLGQHEQLFHSERIWPQFASTHGVPGLPGEQAIREATNSHVPVGSLTACTPAC